jgi:transposase
VIVANESHQGAIHMQIATLARKLLIALWRFVIDGVVPEGAVLKPAA